MGPLPSPKHAATALNQHSVRLLKNSTGLVTAHSGVTSRAPTDALLTIQDNSHLAPVTSTLSTPRKCDVLKMVPRFIGSRTLQSRSHNGGRLLLVSSHVLSGGSDSAFIQGCVLVKKP